MIANEAGYLQQGTARSVVSSVRPAQDVCGARNGQWYVTCKRMSRSLNGLFMHFSRSITAHILLASRNYDKIRLLHSPCLLKGRSRSLLTNLTCIISHQTPSRILCASVDTIVATPSCIFLLWAETEPAEFYLMVVPKAHALMIRSALPLLCVRSNLMNLLDLNDDALESLLSQLNVVDAARMERVAIKLHNEACTQIATRS